MSKGRGPWREGRRAWDRLAEWYAEGAATPQGEGDPLAALSDIGVVRRLLDSAELEAVRGARRRGRSWAEIATRLGVTRQSAWERWRELDVERDESRPVEGREVPLTVEEAPTGPGAVLDSVARAARRRARVTVPNVIGMSFDAARLLLGEWGLVGVASDPDGPSAATLGLEGAVVTDQSPEAGAKAQPGTPVTLWTERGGGSGVREPRRPKPTPRTARKSQEIPSEEAVG
jgi:hypothetical protein